MSIIKNVDADEVEIKVERAEKEPAYFTIETAILRMFSDLEATPGQAVAYWALRQTADYKTMTAKIKHKTLAKLALQSKRTLIDNLKAIEEMGFIRIEKRYNPEKKQFFANSYTIVSLFDVATQLKIEIKPRKPTTKQKTTFSNIDEIAATQVGNAAALFNGKGQYKKGKEEQNETIKIAKKQIDYDSTMDYYKKIINDARRKKNEVEYSNRQAAKDLYETIVTYFFNVLLSEKDYTIDDRTVLNEEIKEKYSLLRAQHIDYLVKAMSNNRKPVTNKEAYIIKSLFNAISAQSFDAIYWANEAQRDLESMRKD